MKVAAPWSQGATPQALLLAMRVIILVIIGKLQFLQEL